MEYDSSYNKQLKKEKTARAVMNKQVRMLQGYKGKNNEKKMRYHEKLIESKKQYVEGDRKVKIIENIL